MLCFVVGYLLHSYSGYCHRFPACWEALLLAWKKPRPLGHDDFEAAVQDQGLGGGIQANRLENYPLQEGEILLALSLRRA